MLRHAILVTLLAAAVQSSPTPVVIERNYATGQVPEVLCEKVNVIVKVLKAYKATLFCSSYLDVPAVTSIFTVETTSVVTVEVTATVTAPTSVITTTSIITVPVSYVFLPGSPQAPGTHKRAKTIKERNNESKKPDYLKAFANDAISTGCQCLDIQVKTNVVSTTSTAASSATSTITTTITPLSTYTATSTTTLSTTTTLTLYPCATPVPTLISTIPYGDAQYSSDLSISNSRFELSDPRGASAEACCNACYFSVSNCIQAYWYSYQGCVVQQAFAIGSGIGVSSSCPSGLFSGLTYVRDNSPAFRSTGDFAGPCGVQYNNL